MKDYRLHISTAQLNAYRSRIADRWSQHQLLEPTSDLSGGPRYHYGLVGDPLMFGYVLVEEWKAETFGLWVGNRENPQQMYIGIEPDGYTHS